LITNGLEKIKYLAFDIDGTLFSSEDIILNVYKESILLYKNRTGSNIEIPSQEKIMAQIGKPVKTIFLNLVPELEEKDRDLISDDVLRILCEKVRNKEGHIYDGVRDTLEKLQQKSYILLTASNGRTPYIDSILDVAGVNTLFTDKVTLDYNKLKVKGDILLHYIEKYNIKPDQILMIGDRFSDFEAAEIAKTPFLFCEYGHATLDEIPHFTVKASKVSDLLTLLN
jgi:phosphoglycolate phosphatase